MLNQYVLFQLAQFAAISKEMTVAQGEVTRQMLARYEAGDLITTCAWCHRVELEGEWLLAPRAALEAIDVHFTLSHSICPACSEQYARKPVSS